MKPDAEVVLNYPAERGEGALAIIKPSSGHWAFPRRTNGNMSVLITAINGIELHEGDQIAAFGEGRMLGVGDVIEGRCGLAIWGDDNSNHQFEEVNDRESFDLKLWDIRNSVERDLDVDIFHAGSGLEYILDSFVALDVSVPSIVPENYSLSQNFPNPFNSITKLKFGLPEDSDVMISVIDVTGRVIELLVNNRLMAGSYSVTWGAQDIASGIYLVKLDNMNEFSTVTKVVLIK